MAGMTPYLILKVSFLIWGKLSVHKICPTFTVNTLSVRGYVYVYV